VHTQNVLLRITRVISSTREFDSYWNEIRENCFFTPYSFETFVIIVANVVPLDFVTEENGCNERGTRVFARARFSANGFRA